MAGSPDLAPILEMLNATRASARERQGEIERKIRAEARKLRQGDAAGKSLALFCRGDYCRSYERICIW